MATNRRSPVQRTPSSAFQSGNRVLIISSVESGISVSDLIFFLPAVVRSNTMPLSFSGPVSILHERGLFHAIPPLARLSRNALRESKLTKRAPRCLPLSRRETVFTSPRLNKPYSVGLLSLEYCIASLTRSHSRGMTSSVFILMLLCMT